MDLVRLSIVPLLVAVVVAGVVLPMFSLSAAAAHDDGDLTVIPSRQPGLEDAGLEVFGLPSQGLDRLEYVRTSWDEGGVAGCSPGNVEEFGIDRGDEDPGTLLEENLLLDVKSTTVSEELFEAVFYEASDFGGDPPRLEAGDEFVTKVNDCVETPDEPGWYQIRTTIGGADDEFTMTSHYFYVCDCPDERAARDRLGPPPSESTPTATATPAATSTPAGTDRSTHPSRQPLEDDESRSRTPTSAVPDTPGTAEDGRADDESTDGESDGPTPTAPSEWSEVVHGSPTASADAPGFGAATAVAGALLAGLLARRRTS